MIVAENKKEQLKHLDKVIRDSNWWYKDKFRVMNNEAGIGKSRQTFKSIAKLANDTDYKIIYVQMFANKESDKQDAQELKNTIKEINNHAGFKVANYLCSENIKDHKKIIAESKIICITQKKYLQLCKDNRSNFINNADVLIIDEFPNLFESFYISKIELMKLQGFTLISDKDKKNIEEMNKFILNKLDDLQTKNGKTMKVINLHKLDIIKYKKLLKTIILHAKKENKYAHKKIIDTALKVLELFKHSTLYTIEKIGKKNYPVLYSFYGDTNYILAKKNNIILDANGGFDGRYKLNKDLFKIDYQTKVFVYENSIINLYPINTSKTAIKSYKNIIKDIGDYIYKTKKDKEIGLVINSKHLIVTDVKGENTLTDFEKRNINECCSIQFGHFGALIGKNNWKDFDNAWIVKTPYFGFKEYILQYIFYSKQDLNGNINCEIKIKKGEYGNYSVFRNKHFNNFKNSIMLGEYYQACKRIARNGKECTFNILTTDEDIFPLLAEQFNGIKIYIESNLNITPLIKEKKKKEKKKSNERNEVIKEYLLNIKNQDMTKIEKAKICEVADLRKDKLSKQLKIIKNWLEENNIKIGTGKEQAYILL